MKIDEDFMFVGFFFLIVLTCIAAYAKPADWTEFITVILAGFIAPLMVEYYMINVWAEVQEQVQAEAAFKKRAASARE